MRKRAFIGLSLLVLGAGVLALLVGVRLPATTVAGHTAVSTLDAKADLSGGAARCRGDNFAGYGWSVEPEAKRAVERAIECATRAIPGSTDLATVFFSAQHDAQKILNALRSGPHPVKHVFGMSSHGGILCADGYHSSLTGVVGVLATRVSGIASGVGGASFDEGRPGEAAKLAYRRAVSDAGVSTSTSKPSLILLSVTLPNEEAVLAGLAEATGPGIPLIGGTAAGSIDGISRKTMSNWSIIANDRIIKNGVGVVVFFSARDFAWSYGGGYRRSSTSGVVTKCQPRMILEIDGRPAAEVYDQWLGGRVTEAAHRGENVINFCTLYPLCRTLGTYNQFIRVWPSGDAGVPGSLRTGVGVQQGDTLYLSEGTWNILLNHFATIPQKALGSRSDSGPMAGLFIYCGGAMECIPPGERPQMAFLVGQNMNDIPWLGAFTWGEQGNIPNVGNLHSSLSAGTVFIPDPATPKP